VAIRPENAGKSLENRGKVTLTSREGLRISRANRGAKSMIRKSGYRFSEKIMLQRRTLDHDPIQAFRIMV